MLQRVVVSQRFVAHIHAVTTTIFLLLLTQRSIKHSACRGLECKTHELLDYPRALQGDNESGFNVLGAGERRSGEGPAVQDNLEKAQPA